MVHYENISVRLAGALLLHRGELSLGEIRALPFIESDEIAAAVANTLSRAFDVERYERRAGRLSPYWEEVIRLRRPVQAAKHVPREKASA